MGCGLEPRNTLVPKERFIITQLFPLRSAPYLFAQALSPFLLLRVVMVNLYTPEGGPLCHEHVSYSITSPRREMPHYGLEGQRVHTKQEVIELENCAKIKRR